MRAPWYLYLRVLRNWMSHPEDERVHFSEEVRAQLAKRGITRLAWKRRRIREGDLAGEVRISSAEALELCAEVLQFVTTKLT